MPQRKKMILAIVLLAVFAAGMFFVYRAFAPGAQAGDKTVTITIVHGDGSRKETVHRTGAAYLLDALGEVAGYGGEEGPYGYVLYTVDGETADFSRGSAFWAIYVDDAFGNFSVDRQPVADGGRYSIVYETG